jgi:hypothetical protein|tara:strand:+ start:2446 stop:2952 length:507 start_codon:yes stop_codon:yes gene_type:complete
MNSRKGTKRERFYGELCTDLVGCVACLIEGRVSDNPNRSWIAFHHNEHEGSKKPGCHFWACGLCDTHHQGTNLGAWAYTEPFRHGFPGNEFRTRYGDDYALGQINWGVLMVLSIPVGQRCSQAGFKYYDLMQHCPFPITPMFDGFQQLMGINDLFMGAVVDLAGRHTK